jgi:hypothetical protein
MYQIGLYFPGPTRIALHAYYVVALYMNYIQNPGTDVYD